MKKRITSIVMIVGIFAAQTLWAQSEVSKTFTGIKKIRLSTSSGSCKIVKSTDEKVSVVIRHSFEKDFYRPELTQDGDRLELKEEFSSSRSSYSGSGPLWTLTIPEGVDLRFKSGSGDIEATNMKLKLDVSTGSGGITLSKVTGEITATTGSGDIELDEFDGMIEASTGSGTARVTNSKGEIRLNCGSGSIRVADSQAEFRASSGSGSIMARNLILAGSSRFSSGSGDAEVVLGATPKYDISVGSGSGNAFLDFHGNAITGEIVMMACKTKGSISAPFDFEKVEEIKEGGDQVVLKKTVVKGAAIPKVSVSTGSGQATISK